MAEDTGQRRTFNSGATRGTAEGKVDIEGAFSVLSLERYGEYMLEHQTDSAGMPRSSDNWQKGFPLSSYVKSLLRHSLALWRINRGFMDLGSKFLEDTLCAIIFNAQGYLHVHLKGRLPTKDETAKTVAEGGLYYNTPDGWLASAPNLEPPSVGGDTRKMDVDRMAALEEE